MPSHLLKRRKQQPPIVIFAILRLFKSIVIDKFKTLQSKAHTVLSLNDMIVVRNLIYKLTLLKSNISRNYLACKIILMIIDFCKQFEKNHNRRSFGFR